MLEKMALLLLTRMEYEIVYGLDFFKLSTEEQVIVVLIERLNREMTNERMD